MIMIVILTFLFTLLHVPISEEFVSLLIFIVFPLDLFFIVFAIFLLKRKKMGLDNPRFSTV